eukprot:SAG31_NODE_2971_length_4839_cov_1.617722_2_plen_98_part_00
MQGLKVDAGVQVGQQKNEFSGSGKHALEKSALHVVKQCPDVFAPSCLLHFLVAYGEQNGAEDRSNSRLLHFECGSGAPGRRSRTNLERSGYHVFRGD